MRESSFLTRLAIPTRISHYKLPITGCRLQSTPTAIANDTAQYRVFPINRGPLANLTAMHRHNTLRPSHPKYSTNPSVWLSNSRRAAAILGASMREGCAQAGLGFRDRMAHPQKWIPHPVAALSSPHRMASEWGVGIGDHREMRMVSRGQTGKPPSRCPLPPLPCHLSLIFDYHLHVPPSRATLTDCPPPMADSWLLLLMTDG